MYIEYIIAPFIVLMENWGHLYFFDTYLQKRTVKFQKYKFFIWFVCIQVCGIVGMWIGLWKVIPVLLVHTFLCLLFYQTAFWQGLFFSVLNYCLMIMMEYLSLLLIDHRWLQTNWIDLDGLWDYLVTLIAKVLWIVLVLLIRKIRRRRVEDYELTNKEWLKVSIIPITTIGVIIVMYNSYIISYTNDERVQNIYLLIAVCMVAINLVVVHLMQEILEKEKALRVSILAYQNQKNQLEAYEDGNKVYEQQRKKMHDYKNQIATIQTLIKGEDYKTALNFAEKLTESISVDMSAINTNHPVVNAVLNQKYRRAKEKNVSMSLKLGDLHELKMKEEDIVIVLGNLLDNAIRECEKLLAAGSEGTLIFLKLVYEDDKMILSIKNPVREKVEIVDNVVQKVHGSGHGIGLSNVKSVVEQYDGDLALDCDEKEFRAVIIL